MRRRMYALKSFGCAVGAGSQLPVVPTTFAYPEEVTIEHHGWVGVALRPGCGLGMGVIITLIFRAEGRPMQRKQTQPLCRSSSATGSRRQGLSESHFTSRSSAFASREQVAAWNRGLHAIFTSDREHQVLEDFWPASLERCHLDEDQRFAVRSLLAPNKVALVTGAAGSGKTAVTAAGVRGLLEREQSVLCTALAGRAVHNLRQRLLPGDAARVRHSTIHSAIGALLRDDWARVDVVIVDEASMVDSDLMWSLVRAAPASVRWVLVGDPGQLPPFRPGTPFEDALAVGAVHCHLPGTHRHAAGSGVLALASAIRHGAPHAPSVRNVHLHAGCKDPLRALGDLVTGGAEPTPVVLTWRHRERLAVNRRLQDLVNPDGRRVATFDASRRYNGHPRAEIELRLGDRVAISENDYGLGVFNGTLGTLVDASDVSMSIRIDGKVIGIPWARVPNLLDLAYCITVHKAQGGEWDHVIAYQPDVVKQDAQRWYYSAVTRARSRLDIVTALSLDAWWANATDGLRTSALSA